MMPSDISCAAPAFLLHRWRKIVAISGDGRKIPAASLKNPDRDSHPAT